MLKILSIFVLSIAIALSGGVLEADAVLAQNHLNIAYSSDPVSLDVHVAPSTSYYHNHIFDTLVVRSGEGDYYGGLATGWDFSDDGTRVTFSLRDDVTFHDGTKFNAEVVKFNFERILDPEVASPHGSLAGPITNITVEDEYTITLEYEEPVAALLYNYSQTFFGMQSPAAIEKYGSDYGNEAVVGTGPYMLEVWKAGEEIVLVKNPDYRWGAAFYDNPGPAKIERLVFQNMPDEMTTLLGLQGGSLDIAGIPTAYIDIFDQNPDVSVQLAPVGRVTYLGINSSKEPWSDARLRQAIAHTIDREEIVQVAMNGYAVPNPTPLAPGVLGYSESLHEYAAPLDIEAGKELLREAGYTERSNGWFDEDGNELIFNIWTYSSDAYSRLAEVTREQIIRLGITVTIETLESATLLSRTPDGDHDSVLIAYGWSDPGILNSFLHSGNLDRSNRVHYVNPELDALLDKGAITVDPEERAALYHEVQKIIIQDAPWVPLFTEHNAIGVNPELKGLRRGPGGAEPRFLDAYFE